MSRPHGGTLVNQMASDKKSERLKEEVQDMKTFKLNSGLRKDVQNIANGVYSPLTGFMCRETSTGYWKIPG